MKFDQAKGEAEVLPTTIADAVLDRLVHNAYRLVLNGESMRKKKQIKQSD